MKCPVCKIEMRREKEGKWLCRNPKCPAKVKEAGKNES